MTKEEDMTTNGKAGAQPATKRRRVAPETPAPLTRDSSVVIATRVPYDLLDRMDRARGSRTRSEFLRDLLEGVA